MKAILKRYRQSPRKIRLVIDAIKGKQVDVAITELQNIIKRASGPLEKLIKSAISNAVVNHGKQRDTLFIKDLRVDDGPTMKRMMPRAKGRGMTIRKRTGHIVLELGEIKEKTQNTKGRKG